MTNESGRVDGLTPVGPARTRQPDPRIRALGRTPVLILLSVAVLAGLRGVSALVDGRGGPPPASLLIAGVSITVQQTAAGDAVLRATYSVSAPGSSAVTRITTVTGPGIRTATVVSADRQGSLLTERIEVRPDCSILADDGGGSAAPAGTPYEVHLAQPKAAGRASAIRRPAPGGVVNWAAAIRSACWQWQAHRSLRVTHVTLGRIAAVPWTAAQVTLANTGRVPVGVHVVDIADVSTIGPADSGTVATQGSRTFTVRISATGCPRTVAAHDQLGWAVGPVGADPVSTIVLPLSRDQAARLAAAHRQACAQPRTGGGAGS